MKVKCPGCKAIMWETTEKYNPDILANGGMVRLLEPWRGWGWTPFGDEVMGHSTTLASMMTCPQCGAMLAPSGRIAVVIPEPDPVLPEWESTISPVSREARDTVKEIFTRPPLTQEEINKETDRGLSALQGEKLSKAGHKRSHPKGVM